MIKAIKNKLKKSEFFTAISTTGFTAILQLLSGIVINKIVALKIGPSGIALLGQFSNFRDMMTRFGTGAIGQGVTKYVADNEYDDNKIITTATFFSIGISVLLSVVILIFSRQISFFLFRTYEYQFILYIFSSTLVLFSLNNLFISIINGKRKFIFLAKIKTANAVISLTVSGLLCWFLSLKGALIAMSINTSIVLLVSLILYFKKGDLFITISRVFWEVSVLKKLMGFTIMSLTGVLLKPLIEIVLRNFIINQASEFDAGLWESMKRISLYYTQIITVALGAYYLPKLSALKDDKDIKGEIYRGIKVIMPLFSILAILIFLIKDIIISFLFSSEFYSIDKLFFPQLLGDFFMLLSFMVAYLLIAKAMIKTFVLTQVVLSVLRILLSIYFYSFWNIEGILWANMIVYVINCIWVFILFRKILFY